MNQELIHVYFMPGMAASPAIFEFIKLPEEQFKIHWLEWKIPLENETLKDYAKRMTNDVKHENIALIGVSFGGILVQEMSRFLTLRKLIVISSVTCKQQLPRRMKFLRKTKLYKILPTSLASNIEVLAKLAYGKPIIKRLALYKKYLSVRDTKYLDWAIEQMVCWEQAEPISGTVHIHGEKDLVFPMKHIKDCMVIKGGTHIMIITKYKWFNENLPRLILH